MCGSDKLLRRPHPFEGEAINGYIARVAMENGFRRSNNIHRLADCSGIIAFREGKVDGLSSLLDIDPGKLANMTYWPQENSLGPGFQSFNGFNVRRRSFNMRTRRVCPHCLIEANYHRSIWNLALVTTCLEHDAMLIGKCPKCRKSLDWSRSEYHACAYCYADLRSETPAPANAYGRAMTAAVLNSVGSLPNAYQADLSSLSHIAHLDANDLANLVLLLGGYSQGVARGGTSHLLSRISFDGIARVAEKAAQSLFDWPAGYHKLLDRLSGSASVTLTESGLSYQFGVFHETLKKKFRASSFEFLQEATAEYFRQRWSGGFLTKKNWFWSPALEESSTWIVRAKAAERLSCRSETIDLLVKRGFLEGCYREQQSRTVLLINRKSLERLEEDRRNELTAKAAREFLGISERPMERLLSRGLVKPKRMNPLNRSRKQVFCRKALQSFLDKLKRQVKESIRARTISHTRALRKLSSVGMGLADLLELALAGEIKVRGWRASESGLAKCIYDDRDIDQLIKNYAELPEDEMTIPLASVRLSLRQEVVYRLVQKGLLEFRLKTVGAREIKVVTGDSVAEFQRTYVSAKEISDLRRTSPAMVVRSLRSKGIVPVTGPSVDRNRQYFFKRKDVGESLVEVSAEDA